jgi:hypothetical protein
MRWSLIIATFLFNWFYYCISYKRSLISTRRTFLWKTMFGIVLSNLIRTVICGKWSYIWFIINWGLLLMSRQIFLTRRNIWIDLRIKEWFLFGLWFWLLSNFLWFIINSCWESIFIITYDINLILVLVLWNRRETLIGWKSLLIVRVIVILITRSSALQITLLSCVTHSLLFVKASIVIYSFLFYWNLIIVHWILRLKSFCRSIISQSLTMDLANLLRIKITNFL